MVQGIRCSVGIESIGTSGSVADISDSKPLNDASDEISDLIREGGAMLDLLFMFSSPLAVGARSRGAQNTEEPRGPTMAKRGAVECHLCRIPETAQSPSQTNGCALSSVMEHGTIYHGIRAARFVCLMSRTFFGGFGSGQEGVRWQTGAPSAGGFGSEQPQGWRGPTPSRVGLLRA